MNDLSDKLEYFQENPEALLVLTDSYKVGHHFMYMNGTQNIVSYFEARNGAKFDETVFFGLQFYLKKFLAGVVVTTEMIDAAEQFNEDHFLGHGKFNRTMWEHVVEFHGGKLPIRIKAIPEGTPVPVNNVMMTVEVTDHLLQENADALMAPLTNFLETILTHVWASSNVATMSRDIKKKFVAAFFGTVEEKDYWMLDYMLHDFGFRGVSSVESAGMSGAGHLVNFKGTDTLVAITYGQRYYNTQEMLAHSVNATEHSVMTQLGPDGEMIIVNHLLDKFPTGILSVVADSYDVVNFVKTIGDGFLKDKILARDGKFVVRPDSPRFEGDTPVDQILWIVGQLAEDFGYSTNEKGYKELNPKVGVIYGDGLSAEEIHTAIDGIVDAGWAASTCVFGQGGGLLQKHNRDTQRYAFKACARLHEGEWHDVFKLPKDVTKASKKGRLKLIINDDKKYQTVRVDDQRYMGFPDEMVVVFENGEVYNELTFQEVRDNAELKFPEPEVEMPVIDTDKILETATETKERITELKESLAAEVKTRLSGVFTELLTAHPKFTEFSWVQYTPYFMDGDPCEFYTNPDYYFDYVLADNPELNGLYKKTKNWNDGTPNPTYDPVFASLVDQATSLVGGVDDDTWKTLFGDHVTVTVTNNDGVVTIDTEEYHHD